MNDQPKETLPIDPQRRSRLASVSGCAAAWAGEELFKLWAESCPWSSVWYEHEWEKLHPHTQDKWRVLASVINNKSEQHNAKLCHGRD